MLWTSIVTGRSADEHGVLSAVEYDALTGGTRPASGRSRRVNALWDIADLAGLKTHVVGWQGTHPAGNLSGSCVSPAFFEPLGRFDVPWPIYPNSLQPDRLIANLAEMRVHPGDLTAKEIVLFIPRLREIDQQRDRRVITLADALAKTLSTHAISTWLMEHEPWNVMMIGWPGLQQVCREFMRYAPPELPDVDAGDCALYGGVVRAMYCYHDMLLGRIVELAGPDASIAIVSAAGFRAGKERPISKALQSRPEAWHRPFGMFCIAGPRSAQDELLHNVSMYDVTPTLLHALNLPAGEDMPGRVRLEAFTGGAALDRISSWDEGNVGTQPEEKDDSALATIAELRALGYDAPVTTETERRIQRERRYHTALVHISRRRYSKARAELSLLAGEHPEPHIALMLAYAQYRAGDFVAASAQLREFPRETPLAANARLLESYVAFAQKDLRKAAADAVAAERIGFDRPVLLLIAALMFIRLRNLGRAETALRAALELDPSFEKAWSLLARVLKARGKADEAAAAARKGLAVEYGSASLHSGLGVALAESSPDEALEEFETALQFDPHFLEASRWSAVLEHRKKKTA